MRAHDEAQKPAGVPALSFPMLRMIEGRWGASHAL
jgi:hypothetical protein